MMKQRIGWGLGLVLVVMGCRGGARYEPKLEEGWELAEAAKSGFRLAPEFSAHLVAAEPQLGNPVAFSIPRRGLFEVAETYRQEDFGVPDNRTHPEWVDDDLEAQEVEDRRAYTLRWQPSFREEYTKHHDLIRHVFDEDQDGVADRSAVWADGFNDLVDGTGAGVLTVDGWTYYTCIPHLWRLRDADGDGYAEERESLFWGFGVRTALRGHDMHGLVRGLDGRLYWSIGDRGYSVVTKEGELLADPRSGAVFRMWPDGSGLEVFATGLRNPQELAFDDFGRLFTVDNNSDSDDKARVLYLPEGSETGWRMNFQTLPRRGPWVEEEWWKAQASTDIAFRLPPLAHLGSGPSGLVAYPGTGLSANYDGRFFVCDFLGGRKDSGVISFAVDREGAGFRFRDSHHVIRGLLPTDVDFGPDGKLYVLDWVEGWTGAGRGRIYRLDHPGNATESMTDTVQWLERDLSTLGAVELVGSLVHADRRVRLRIQAECVRRGPAAYPALRDFLDRDRPAIAKVHALWALATAGRRDPDALIGIARTFEHPSADLRGQVVRALGEVPGPESLALAERALLDPDRMVQAEACLALARLRHEASVGPILDRVDRDDTRDVWLRHAASVALGRLATAEDLAARHSHASSTVRMVSLLALRRQRSEQVAVFLQDAEPALRIEAARAIFDLPLRAAWPSLMETLDRAEPEPIPVLRRALLAAEALGTPEAVARLGNVVMRQELPESVRVAAASSLRRWRSPPRRDDWVNEPWQLAARTGDGGIELGRLVPALLRDSVMPLRILAAQAAGEYAVAGVASELETIAGSDSEPTRLRVASLESLTVLSPDGAARVARSGLRNSDHEMRGAAISSLAEVAPDELSALLDPLLSSGSVPEVRGVLRALSKAKDGRSEALLLREFTGWTQGSGRSESALELLEAVQARAKAGSSSLERELEDYQERNESADIATRHRAALLGGDADRGRRTFREHAGATCLRCHDYEAPDLAAARKAGPTLQQVGARLTREELLRSLVEPNATIADGYLSEAFELSTGEVLSGRLLRETETQWIIETLDTGVPVETEIEKADLTDRRREGSAMPSDLLEKISASELRDLVEFLSYLR